MGRLGGGTGESSAQTASRRHSNFCSKFGRRVRRSWTTQCVPLGGLDLPPPKPKAPMDAAEKIVEALLLQMGLSTVRHEPNGQGTFPDFGIENDLAIEVRRLNQNHEQNGVARGLEEDAIPLRQKIERMCRDFGEGDSTSWFVCYSFKRPLTPWKQLKPALERALRNFMGSPHPQGGLIFKDSTFKLEVVAASTRFESCFVLGSMLDLQAGGWVVAEFLRNVEHCIRVKTMRLQACSTKYRANWLVLVNVSGLRLDSDDRSTVTDRLRLPAEWNRVLIVGAGEKDEWFELEPASPNIPPFPITRIG